MWLSPSHLLLLQILIVLNQLLMVLDQLLKRQLPVLKKCCWCWKRVVGVDPGEVLTHEQLLTLKERLSKLATNLQDKAVEEVKKKPPEVSTRHSHYREKERQRRLEHICKSCDDHVLVMWLMWVGDGGDSPSASVGLPATLPFQWFHWHFLSTITTWQYLQALGPSH